MNELDRVFRMQWPHLLATLIRYTGSPELAEDALQEAFARASASRDRTLLINPAAWVTTVAKRVAVDTVRRDAAFARRLPLLAEREPHDLPPATMADERLELLLLACTPSLEPEQRVGLALRFVFGVSTADIADAMLVQHTAMSARLTRAKRRIEADGLGRAEPRLDDVLTTIYVLYTIGHTLPEGSELADADLTTAAIELAREVRALHPGEREADGLVALLLLTEARTPGRRTADGLVSLEHADRSTWQRDRIAEGIALATAALPGGGRYALEAGISGLHSTSPTWADTDWEAICMLYDRLVERSPSPSALVARVVARSHRRGGLPGALAELDTLGALPGAANRAALTARADVLRRLDRTSEARDAYLRARSVQGNAELRGWLDARLSDLD